MPIVYKIDVLAELKNHGFTTYRMRNEHLLGEATIQQLRNNTLVSWANIEKICCMLKCQPGDLIKYIEVCHADI